MPEPTYDAHYRRLLEEVAIVLGAPEQKDQLLQTRQVQVGDYLAWFIHDEILDPGHLFVYVDIGVPAPEKAADAYRRLLRFNMELLGSSVFATTGLRPDNDHVIYAYRYTLGPTSTGQGLMDSLLKVVRGLSLDNLPSAVPERGGEKNWYA